MSERQGFIVIFLKKASVWGTATLGRLEWPPYVGRREAITLSTLHPEVINGNQELICGRTEYWIRKLCL
jgi:hypothetical protein